MQLEPLTAVTALTTWHADPLALALAAVLGGGYGLGLRRRPGWPRARTAAFFGLGIAPLLLVSVTFVGAYATVLFWVRALQIVVLFMVVPLGLAMGAPVTLAGDRWVRMLRLRPVAVLAHPVCGTALMLGTPWVLLFTGWYPAGLRWPVVDVATRLLLVVIGFVYFAGRLQVDPMPREYPHGVAMVISVVEEIVDAVLGLVLWLGPHLVAGQYYAALHRTWGPDLRTDQILAAGIVWVGGDLAALPFLAALLRRMVRRHDERVAEIDSELDAAEAALALPRNGSGGSGGSGDSDDVGVGEPVLSRPWWETDPRFADRYPRRR